MPSAYSNIVSASFPTTPVLSASVDGSDINLSWTASVVVGSSISNYLIYQSTDGVNFSLYDEVDGSTLSYDDSDLDPGTYYYYVQAQTEDGRFSADSNIVSGEIIAVELADIVQNSYTQGSDPYLENELSWTYGATANTYEVWRQLPGGSFSLLMTVSGSTTNYNDAGLRHTWVYGEYSYYVVAKDADGNILSTSNTQDTTWNFWTQVTDGFSASQQMYGMAGSDSSILASYDDTNSTNTISSSADGITFTPAVGPAATGYLSYLNDAWYLTTAVNSSHILRSTDGSNWTDVSDNNANNGALKSVQYGGGKYARLWGRNDPSDGTCGETSSDGITWGTITLPGTSSSNPAVGFTWTGTQWFVLLKNGTALTSSDFSTWTTTSGVDPFAGTLYGDAVSFADDGNGTVVALWKSTTNSGLAKCAVSTDYGTTWATMNAPVFNYYPASAGNCLVYEPVSGRWCAVGPTSSGYSPASSLLDSVSGSWQTPQLLGWGTGDTYVPMGVIAANGELIAYGLRFGVGGAMAYNFY